MDVVQERNYSNQVTAQLVRDGNIGGILSRTTTAGVAFYGYDGNGNVTLLTNSAGQDVGHYRYDAFGQTLEAEGPRAGENPYRFLYSRFYDLRLLNCARVAATTSAGVMLARHAHCARVAHLASGNCWQTALCSSAI